MKIGLTLLGLSIVTLAACSLGGGNSNVGTSEDDDTINPGDNEDLGYVVVRSPLAPSALGYTLTIGDGPNAPVVKPDTPLRLKEGSYRLKLSYTGPDWSTAT